LRVLEAGVFMKAVRWHAPRDLRIEEVDDIDKAPSGCAVIDVAFCGVCGTDVKEFTSGPQLIRPGPHPFTGAAPPLTLGHEISGRIMFLPDVTSGFSVGDRVAIDPCWRCGVCDWCVSGRYNICVLGGSVGLASDGGFAERVVVPLAGLCRIPDNVDDQTAALAEPLAVGVHAVSRAGFGVGESALIIGAGAIGNAVLLAVRAAGASTIFISDPEPQRRQQALDNGASAVFDPAKHDVVREVRAVTHRVGVHAVFDATGNARLALGALECVRRDGALVVAGVGSSTAEVDVSRITLFERRIVGTLGYRSDIPKVLNMISAGTLDISNMSIATHPLGDAPRVLEEIAESSNMPAKIMFYPGSVP
jgi:(R,R)-butanediol dehydrogenase/meso-butanediol dehydrogenase/diacetyl reductase